MTRPEGSDQRCPYTPITREPDPSERLNVHAGAQQRFGGPSRPLGGGHQVLALGAEQAELVPPAPLVELAHRLQLFVVG
jgi:hypothetical protein